MHDGVLIVDDNAAIRSALAAVLELANFRVTTAQNGIEALAAIELECPGLILLDVHMPLLDGPGVARSLAERGLRIPIIVMTSDPRAEAYAREMQATAYLPKPCGIGELLALVQRSLGVSG